MAGSDDADDAGAGADGADADPGGLDPLTADLPPGSPVLEAVLENARRRRDLGRRLEATGDRLDVDVLGDVVRHGPVLEALLDGPLDRREIEARLDVSRATSHRFVHWLDDRGLVEKVDGRLALTGQGEAVAEEVLRFEANVRAADELAPLLETVCADHQEFVIEPFTDARVAAASPDDPFAPMDRFVALLEGSTTLRGFAPTHLAPLAFDGCYRALLEATETSLVARPAVVEALLEAHPDAARAGLAAGTLDLRTREDLPYGLALFDERVGIAGYDDDTGAMHVFVDADDPIAREWAERVYASVLADSTPVPPDRLP